MSAHACAALTINHNQLYWRAHNKYIKLPFTFKGKLSYIYLLILLD